MENQRTRSKQKTNRDRWPVQCSLILAKGLKLVMRSKGDDMVAAQQCPSRPMDSGSIKKVLNHLISWRHKGLKAVYRNPAVNIIEMGVGKCSKRFLKLATNFQKTKVPHGSRKASRRTWLQTRSPGGPNNDNIRQLQLPTYSSLLMIVDVYWPTLWVCSNLCGSVASWRWPNWLQMSCSPKIHWSWCECRMVILRNQVWSCRSPLTQPHCGHDKQTLSKSLRYAPSSSFLSTSSSSQKSHPRMDLRLTHLAAPAWQRRVHSVEPLPIK